MGTEVLRPQDCLIERMRVGPAVFHRRKAYTGFSNPRPCRKQVIRLEPKKRLPQLEPSFSKNSSVDDSRSAKNTVAMGQVTILKRGESLDFKRKNETLTKKTVSPAGDLVVCSAQRFGPNPEMVQKQIRVTDLKPVKSSPVVVRTDVYAGPAFTLSPSPSSLPLPTFSKKKEGLSIVDDSATKDLRRLLRLD